MKKIFLNKFYQNITKIIILGFLIFIFVNPVYSQEQSNQILDVMPGNTIISLSVNDKLSYDYEVYINSNNSFNLPFKAIAGLLEISYKQNHLTKDINFTLEGGKSGLISYEQQKIYIGTS